MVEIKEIKNTLDKIVLKNELTSQQGSHVRFDADTGEITWDEVDNATGYDVWVDLAIASTEGAWGKYYLKPEGEGFQKIQNRFESSELTPVEEVMISFISWIRESERTEPGTCRNRTKRTENKFKRIGTCAKWWICFSNRFNAEEDCKGYIYIIPRNQRKYLYNKGMT